MTEEIKGIVQENPLALEQCCLFALEQGDGSYLVVLTDRQARINLKWKAEQTNKK